MATRSHLLRHQATTKDVQKALRTLVQAGRQLELRSYAAIITRRRCCSRVGVSAPSSSSWVACSSLNSVGARAARVADGACKLLQPPTPYASPASRRQCVSGDAVQEARAAAVSTPEEKRFTIAGLCQAVSECIAQGANPPLEACNRVLAGEHVLHAWKSYCQEGFLRHVGISSLRPAALASTIQHPAGRGSSVHVH